MGTLHKARNANFIDAIAIPGGGRRNGLHAKALNWRHFLYEAHNRPHRSDGQQRGAMHDGRTAIYRRDFLRRQEISRLGPSCLCRPDPSCSCNLSRHRIVSATQPVSDASRAWLPDPRPSRGTLDRFQRHHGLELSRKPSTRLHGGSSSLSQEVGPPQSPKLLRSSVP